MVFILIVKNRLYEATMLIQVSPGFNLGFHTISGLRSVFKLPKDGTRRLGNRLPIDYVDSHKVTESQHGGGEAPPFHGYADPLVGVEFVPPRGVILEVLCKPCHDSGMPGLALVVVADDMVFAIYLHKLHITP